MNNVDKVAECFERVGAGCYRAVTLNGVWEISVSLEQRRDGRQWWMVTLDGSQD